MLTELKPKATPARLHHRFIDSTYVRFRKAEWGGLHPDTLVIVATIPLARGSEGYDEDKVLELERTVSHFLKANHSPYPHIEFIQKNP